MARKTSPYLFPEREEVEQTVGKQARRFDDDDRPVLGYDSWDIGNKHPYDGYLSYTKRCPVHTGAESVYRSLDKLVSLGGAQGHDVNGTAADLVLDLAGLYSGAAIKLIKSGPDDWLHLNALVPKVAPSIVFNWPDGAAVPANVEFWRQVWIRLKATAVQTRHVIVCCAGGHGRTGTALASLILADDLTMTADTAMQWVRAHHCASAIETKDQERYLRLLAQQR
jgi:hypothetical protein